MSKFAPIGFLVFFFLFHSKPALAESVDETLARCPSASEIASVNARLSLSFEGDPTAPALVCTAAAGSGNITLLQMRAYNTLLVLGRLNFDATLPWTSPPTASLQTWLYTQSHITGMRFRHDITTSYCCEPANVINIAVQPNSYIILTDRWIDPTMGGGLMDTAVLMVHESRHNQGLPHDCGSNDNTVEEFGAWGVQLTTLLWIANHSDPSYVRPASTDVPYDYYRDVARNDAETVRGGRFCHDSRVLQTQDAIEYYNTILNHYFMTASSAEASYVDDVHAGPGWVRTGQRFKVFSSAESAPVNALPVCRFHGTPGIGPDSHFYTVNPDECANVKTNSYWTYESVAFYALKPSLGICPWYAGNTPSQRVWRNYGFAQENHRYTTDINIYDQMRAAGWIGEGVMMCGAS
jgi:hypothetical protein